MTFTSTGGTPPVRWYIADLGYDDSTSTPLADGGLNGSSLAETTGVLTAGTGQAGYVLVQAVDSAGAETFAEVTVGSPTGVPQWGGDSGIIASTCGGSTGGGDGGTIGTGDGGGIVGGGGEDGGGVGALPDGGTTGEDGGGAFENGGSSSASCSCTTAGRGGGAPAGVLGGIALGLGLIARRRRSRR